MNPVFVVLVLLAAFLIWLLCSFLYRPIGKIARRLIDDAQEAMEKDEEEIAIDEIVKKKMEGKEYE